MNRQIELSADWRRCRSGRRCRHRSCDYCGPLRAGDEYRKFQDNIAAYGGRVVLVAVTGPGAAEGLPWDPDRCEIKGPHKHGGVRGCRIVHDLAEDWNESASERYARMWKGASVEADRWLRRLGYRGQLPRRVANAWAPQRRGVWHVHEALPGRALRSYVSRRLTSKTGVTIRNLRRVRYLFVILRDGLPIPKWPEAELELVWRLLADGVVATRGP